MVHPDLSRLSLAPVGTPSDTRRQIVQDATTGFNWSELPSDLQKEITGRLGCTVLQKTWCPTHRAACGDMDDKLYRLAGVPRGSEPYKGWPKHVWLQHLCEIYSTARIFALIGRPNFSKGRHLSNLKAVNSDWRQVDWRLVRWVAFAAPPKAVHEVRLTAELLSNAALTLLEMRRYLLKIEQALANGVPEAERRWWNEKRKKDMRREASMCAVLLDVLHKKLTAATGVYDWAAVPVAWRAMNDSQEQEWDDLTQMEKYSYADQFYVNMQEPLQERLDLLAAVTWNGEAIQQVRDVVSMLEQGASPDIFHVGLQLHSEWLSYDNKKNKLFEWLWDQCERGAPPEVVDMIVPWIMWVESHSTERLKTMVTRNPTTAMRLDTLVRLCSAMCLLFADNSKDPMKNAFTDACKHIRRVQGQTAEAERQAIETIEKIFAQEWDWDKRRLSRDNPVTDTYGPKGAGQYLAHPRFSYGMWRMRKTLWPNWTPPRSGEAVETLPRDDEGGDDRTA